MSEHQDIFEEGPSSHPLDLLINAISGTGEYGLSTGVRDGLNEVDLNLDGILSTVRPAHDLSSDLIIRRSLSE